MTIHELLPNWLGNRFALDRELEDRRFLDIVGENWPNVDVDTPLREDEEERLVTGLFRYGDAPRHECLRSSARDTLAEHRFALQNRFRQEAIRRFADGNLLRRIGRSLERLGERVFQESEESKDRRRDLTQARAYVARLGMPFVNGTSPRPEPIKRLWRLPEPQAHAPRQTLQFDGRDLTLKWVAETTERLIWGLMFKGVRGFRATDSMYAEPVTHKGVPQALCLRPRSSWVDQLLRGAPSMRDSPVLRHYLIPWCGAVLEIAAEDWVGQSSSVAEGDTKK